MSKFLSGLLTAFLVICAALVAGALVKREWFPAQRPESQRPASQDIPGWEALAAEGHRMGASPAAVTIVEFSDFLCPFCAEAQHALRKVRQEYPHQVAVIYRHFPRARNPHAHNAAL